MFLNNKLMTIEKQYKAIRKRFRTKENGPAMDSMERLGIHYGKNHGASVRELQQMAKEYSPNQELANYMWQQDVREAKLMALYIADSQDMTSTEMDNWVHEFTNGELVEQACMQLFDKSPLAYQKSVQWLADAHDFTQTTAYVLASRIALQPEGQQAFDWEIFIEHALLDASTDSVFLKKAIARALLAIGNRNEQLKQKVLAQVKTIGQKDSLSSKWIENEVGSLLDFQ